jgi:hypothetical protein
VTERLLMVMKKDALKRSMKDRLAQVPSHLFTRCRDNGTTPPVRARHRRVLGILPSCAVGAFDQEDWGRGRAHSHASLSLSEHQRYEHRRIQNLDCKNYRGRFKFRLNFFNALAHTFCLGASSPREVGRCRGISRRMLTFKGRSTRSTHRERAVH